MNTKLKFRIAVGTVLTLFAATLCLPAFADEVLAGTWRLVKRQLPDGRTLSAPEIGGMASRSPTGRSHHSVFWKTSDGKPASVSGIITYEYGDKEITATRHFSAFDDGSGKPIVYATPEETRRVALKREGSKLSYQHPFDPPFIVIDGDSMTATLQGAFVDYWERIK